MKIMLVDPPQFQINPMISNVRLPSSGLMALNTYLHAAGHDVRYVDCKNSHLYFDDIRREVADFQPAIVGVTAFTLDAYSAMITCEIVKEVSPKTVTVMGGYHATAVPELTLRTCPALDFCGVGESELTLMELTHGLSNGGLSAGNLSKIQGLAYRNGSEDVFRTGHRQLIKDLDSLPLTYLGNLDLRTYHFPVTTRTLNQRVGFGFSFSRGCLFNCKYCSNFGMWEQKWRTFSPKRMIEEIKQLHDNYGKTNFFFYDNDFLMDPDRVEAFLDLLEQSGLAIQWAFETSTAFILRSAELFPRMKRNGLYMCMVGFEFASQARLKAMGKDRGSLERSRNAAKVLKDNEVLIFALGIVGFPDETKESIAEFVEFFTSLHPDMVYTQALTPLPGTELFREMRQEARIGTYDFSRYDLLTPILRYDHASAEEVANWHRDASELLFTPLCLDMYTEYRRHRISLNELTDRYAHVSHTMLEHNRGQVKFYQVVDAYNEAIVRADGLSTSPPADDEVSLPAEKRRAVMEKMRSLDERWAAIMGEEFAPLDEYEQKIVFQQMTRKLPMDQIQKILNRKMSRDDLVTLWASFLNDDRNKAEVKREVVAEREWRRKVKRLHSEQAKHIDSCLPCD